MKTQKQNYLSPVTETLVVRFEGVVCQSTNYGGSGEAGPGTDDEDYGGF